MIRWINITGPYDRLVILKYFFAAPLQGLKILVESIPRALPWAVYALRFQRANHFSSIRCRVLVIRTGIFFIICYTQRFSS
ncbi:MAG: hypothetical protein R6U27_17135 [Desulfobacterales bacterium]